MALARQAVVSEWETVRAMAIEGLSNRRFDHYVSVLVKSLQIVNRDIDFEAEPIHVDLTKIPFEWWLIYWERAVETRKTFDAIYQHQVQFVEGFPLTKKGAFKSRSVGFLRPIGRGSTLIGRLDEQREINDNERNAATRLLQALKINDGEVQRHSRVIAVLSAVSGRHELTEPQAWWNWWLNQTSTEIAGNKPTIQCEEYYWRDGPSRPRHFASCLPAGTPVVTEAGPKAIESLRVGNRLLAKDIVSGELAFRTVLHTTVRSPQPLKKLHTASDTIVATLGHYFWVSGQGWRMAKELKPGDRLHGVTGTVTLTDVSDGELAPVYNLVVERANTYFVGNSRILSHDVTPPAPTNITVPGLASR